MIGCKHKCEYAVGKADIDYDLFDAKKCFAQGLAQDLLLRKFLCGSNEIHNIPKRVFYNMINLPI